MLEAATIKETTIRNYYLLITIKEITKEPKKPSSSYLLDSTVSQYVAEIGVILNVSPE